MSPAAYSPCGTNFGMSLTHDRFDLIERALVHPMKLGPETVMDLGGSAAIRVLHATNFALTRPPADG